MSFPQTSGSNDLKKAVKISVDVLVHCLGDGMIYSSHAAEMGISPILFFCSLCLKLRITILVVTTP